MRQLLYGLLLGAGAALVALGGWTAGVLDLWEYAAWSWRVAAFARPAPTTGQIKLILLDQASLDWGEKENGWSWPWPREVYAPIIDFCRRGGARAVIFDVLYTEPSIYGVADDAALGAAIGRAPAFVAAMVLGMGSGEHVAWPPGVPVRRPLRIANLDAWLTAAERPAVRMSRAACPVLPVARNAAMLANVSDEPDRDGIFRRSTLFRVFDGQVIPSLGVAAFLAGDASVPSLPSQADERLSPSSGNDLPSTEVRIEEGTLHIGERAIPIDACGRAVPRFRGPAGSYGSFSAAAVIQSELRLQAGERPPIASPEVFKDCYVFLGFTAPGLLDLRPTPIAPAYPGVEFHATVLDNLLNNDFLREASGGAVCLFALFLAVCSATLILLSRKAWQNVAVFAVMLPVPVGVGFGAYGLGIWFPVVAPLGAVSLALVGAVVVNYATQGRRKAFIKKAFRHYLSPEVIERILEDPTHLKLGGERRELTILFSDLQGFSSISERLDPEALTSLLNDYLSDMTDLILEEGGTLDKYEGDAIIAFWNAPSDQPDHARRACRAAIRCQRRLAERREEFRQRTGVALYARIGLNTGEVVVGNMGSRKRFDYTVLGDAANLASRLEGANKAFGTYLMASETTWLQAQGGVGGREMGLLRVVGRKTPVRVFELRGFPGEEDRLETFHQGLRLCYAGRWAEALERFEGCPDDPVARVYAERCRAILASPAGTWDGVWNLTEK